MNLVLDIGNTRVKAGVFDRDECLFTESHPELTDQILRSIFNRSRITQGAYCSVKADDPDWLTGLRQSIELFKVTAELKLPFKSAYVTPETLGPDRIAAVAAVATLYPSENVLVVDAGSCITFDFIDKTGVYRGGSISPGIQMRYRALNHFTAKLPLIADMGATALTGNSTTSSVVSGVLNGVLAEFDGIIQQYQSLHSGLKTVLSGGDAPFFESNLKTRIFAAPNLVLYGLNTILKLNEVSP